MLFMSTNSDSNSGMAAWWESGSNLSLAYFDSSSFPSNCLSQCISGLGVWLAV